MRKSTSLAMVLALTTVSVGCATKKYVRKETVSVDEALRQHITLLEDQIEETQDRLEGHDLALVKQGTEIAKTSDTAREALERAQAAGELAEGKLLYEVVFDSDELAFDFESATLNDASKEALDGFAARLKEENANVFIEIQGHTDSSGPDEFNLQLGERRADAVRRYLNAEHQLPLHRMSVISYGEMAPLVDNDTRENRARNRRVALVVLM